MACVFLPDQLCDPAFAAALGFEPTSGRTLELAGYGVAQATETALPGLERQSGATVAGRRFDMSPETEAVLRDVFSASGSDLVSEAVEGHALLVPLARRGGAFDAKRWQTRMLPAWSAALPDLIFLRNQFSPSEIAQRLPMILSRGHSRARAGATPRTDNSGFSRDDVVVEQYARPYAEYFALNEYQLRHRTYSGGRTDPLQRAVFLAVDAVTVLPYDPARDRILLVEQFRAGPFGRGDPHPWLLEPIAGRIEPGHTPEETAHKETEEEAGLRLRALHKIGEYYPSTGCFAEYLVSYIGIADLPDGIEGLHGVDGEGEDIRSHLLSRTELLTRIEAGEMPDGPLLLSAYWLELNRARLLAG